MVASPTSVRTRSGIYLDIADPKATDFNLNDICVALSRVPRFNGHTSVPYSVAQHSYFVGRLMKRWGVNPLAGYLHDASEAYISDIPSPAKRLLPEYYVVEDRLMAKIAERFGLSEGFQHTAIVKTADIDMLFYERDALIDRDIRWQIEDQHPGGSILDHFPGWTPWGAETAAHILQKAIELELLDD